MTGLSNYPPGVTGNEYEIVGWPTCGCGHEPDEHGEDGICQGAGCSCCEYHEDGPDDDYGPEACDVERDR